MRISAAAVTVTTRCAHDLLQKQPQGAIKTCTINLYHHEKIIYNTLTAIIKKPDKQLKSVTKVVNIIYIH